MIRNFLSEYNRRPWPKLEVPPITRRSTIGLVIFVLALVAIGWMIWALPGTSIDTFAMLGIGIPILFFLKSRWVTIVGLLTFQVIIAFMFMGNSEYALYAVFGLVGVIIAFEASEIIYMFFVAALFFSSITSFTTNPLMLHLVAGGALILGWVFRQLSSTKSISRNLYFPDRWIPIIFLLWAGFGVMAWSINPLESGWLQLKMLSSGIFLFLISPLVLETERQLSWALWAWVVAAILAGISTFVPLGPLSMVTGELSTEAAIALKNVTAAFVSYSLFLVLAIYFYSKSFLARFGLSLIGLFLAGVLFSLYSRAATGAAAVAFALFLLIDMFVVSKKKNTLRIISRLFIYFSLVVAILIAVYFLNLGDQLGSYEDLFYGPQQSTTWAFRLQTWSITLEMISKEGHIIRGLGLGAFWELAPGYGFVITNYDEDISMFHPHELYLSILLHYGVVGLLLFVSLMFLNMRNLWRIIVHSDNLKYKYIALGLFCGLFASYLHNTIDGDLFGMTDFWLYLGLTTALINIVARYNSIMNMNQLSQ